MSFESVNNLEEKYNNWLDRRSDEALFDKEFDNEDIIEELNSQSINEPYPSDRFTNDELKKYMGSKPILNTILGDEPKLNMHKETLKALKDPASAIDNPDTNTTILQLIVSSFLQYKPINSDNIELLYNAIHKIYSNKRILDSFNLYLQKVRKENKETALSGNNKRYIYETAKLFARQSNIKYPHRKNSPENEFLKDVEETIGKEEIQERVNILK